MPPEDSFESEAEARCFIQSVALLLVAAIAEVLEHVAREGGTWPWWRRAIDDGEEERVFG
jgi:hypothetical protein